MASDKPGPPPPTIRGQEHIARPPSNRTTEVKVIEHIPMHLNLGDPSVVIGWADVYRDREKKTARIEITLYEEGSGLLDHFQEIAEVKAIGFAGIMRRPPDRRRD